MNPDRFPDRSELIPLYSRDLLASLERRDFDKARQIFPHYIELLRQQNVNVGGGLEEVLVTVREQYARFALEDPLFARALDLARPIIAARPGILQTEIYDELPSVPKEELAYVLYFAAHHGKIVRTKKGRTYEIHLPKKDVP
jgi:hypothetical protein